MEKKTYICPEIIQELELETRAGTPITEEAPGPLPPGNNFPWPPDDGG